MRIRRWWIAFSALVLVSTLAEAAPKKKGTKPSRGKEPKVVAPAIPALDPKLADQIFDVLEKATRSGEMRARGAAYYGLAVLQRPGFDTTAYLLDGLKDPQAIVRLGATRGLIHVQNAAYREAFLQLLADRMTDFDGGAVPILASMPVAEAAALVADALASDKNKRQDDLVRALLGRGGELLLASVEEAVKRGGAAALAFKKTVPTLDVDAAAAVYPKLLPVADEELKTAIIANIERFPADTSIEFVRPLTKDASQAVAYAAARALALRGDADAATVLLPAAKSDDQKTRLMALEAIQMAATAKHLPELEPLLDPAMRMPPNVVGLVWGAFAHAGDASVAPQLRAALTSTEGQLREYAVRYLGLLEGGRALPTLQEKILDGNPKVRENAALALGDIGTSEAIAPLEAALNDPSEAVRLGAVKSLARIQDPRVVQTMQFLVSDPNVDIKLVTIKALARLKSLDAVSTLNIALQDADPSVRDAALRAVMATDLVQGRSAFKTALGWLPPGSLSDMARTMGKDFAGYIGLALEHTDANARAEALRAIRILGSDVEMSLLEGIAQKSPFATMKLDALRRLAELGQPSVATELQAILLNPESDAAQKIDAVTILGDARATSASDALQLALIDPNEALRVEAAIALLKLNLPQP